MLFRSALSLYFSLFLSYLPFFFFGLRSFPFSSVFSFLSNCFPCFFLLFFYCAFFSLCFLLVFVYLHFRDFFSPSFSLPVFLALVATCLLSFYSVLSFHFVYLTSFFSIDLPKHFLHAVWHALEQLERGTANDEQRMAETTAKTSKTTLRVPTRNSNGLQQCNCSALLCCINLLFYITEYSIANATKRRCVAQKVACKYS